MCEPVCACNQNWFTAYIFKIKASFECTLFCCSFMLVFISPWSAPVLSTILFASVSSKRLIWVYHFLSSFFFYPSFCFVLFSVCFLTKHQNIGSKTISFSAECINYWTFEDRTLSAKYPLNNVWKILKKTRKRTLIFHFKRRKKKKKKKKHNWWNNTNSNQRNLNIN